MSEWRSGVRRRGSHRGEGSDRHACSPARALYSMSSAPKAGSIHVQLNWARPAGCVEVEYGATLGSTKHLLLLLPRAPQVSYLPKRGPPGCVHHLVPRVQNIRAPSHPRSTVTVLSPETRWTTLLGVSPSCQWNGVLKRGWERQASPALPRSRYALRLESFQCATAPLTGIGRQQ